MLNMQFPTDKTYRITALFGERIISKGSKNHKGIDIGCPTGTKVYAVADGVVEIHNQGSKGYGLYVVVNHSNGVKTLYAHGSGIPPGIKNGSIVKKGTVIMYSGNSGSSKGPHLHFEIIINGNKVDPLPFFSNMVSDLLIKEETISWAQKDAYNKYLELKK